MNMEKATPKILPFKDNDLLWVEYKSVQSAHGSVCAAMSGIEQAAKQTGNIVIPGLPLDSFMKGILHLISSGDIL
ncbi:MAG: hypothetical protein FWD21_04750, partial [Peptococcaceae bacterium]|nr:hypothetical protein [Peptococcaceae bacterium]